MRSAPPRDELLDPPMVMATSEKVTEPKLARPVLSSSKVTSSRIHSASLLHSVSEEVTVLLKLLPVVLFSRTTEPLVELSAVTLTLMT